MHVVPSGDDNGRLGGLAFLWMEEVTTSLVSFPVYHIDMEVKCAGCDQRIRTSFYGEPVANQRWRSWDMLKQLKNRSMLSWVCAGDFNEALFQHEKWGGGQRDVNQMERFHEALTHCKRDDMGFQGPKLTWAGVRADGARIRCRLDRVVADNRWQDVFPRSQVLVENTNLSDHCAVVLYCKRDILFTRRE